MVFLVALTLALISTRASAEARDAGLAAGRPLAPVSARWRPERQLSPLPVWAPGPVDLQEGQAVFPLPARWQQPAIDRYILTVVFEDAEDSGPTVEWRSAGGVVTRLSDGLGEGGGALGLHARTVVLPDAMTRDGGAVVVSMPWRMEGLVSASVQPARDVTIAVPGAGFHPGMVERAGVAVASEELEGREVPPSAGDVREGPVVEAELSANIEALEHELEFLVPMEGEVDGAILYSEALGLDPEARVDVEINGRKAGEMNSAAFRLDDPTAGVDSSGRLTIAGWRKHSLFLPARLWVRGENSIVLRYRPPSHGARSVYPVSIKNTFLHVLFGSGGAVAAAPSGSGRGIATAISEPWPVNLDEPTSPDFSSPIAIVDEPPVLPLVVTAPPPARETLPLVTVRPEAP